MKWIVLGIAAVALAIVALSIPAPVGSSHAFASKMDGKGSGCSDHMCMGINASKKKQQQLNQKAKSQQ